MGSREIATTRTERFCDVCGSILVGFGSGGRCVICGRDACYRCSHEGDDCWCLPCWEVGKPYRERLDALTKAHEAACEAELCAWRAACRVSGGGA
jgi:hypothetical protein